MSGTTPTAVQGDSENRAPGSPLARVIPRSVWRGGTAVWLLFLVFPLVGTPQRHEGPLAFGGVVVAALALAALYLALMLHRPLEGAALPVQAVRLHLAGVVVLIVLVVMLTLVHSADWLWFLFYGGLTAGAALPPRPGIAVTVALMALALVLGGAVAGGLNAGRFALLTGLGGFSMLGLGRLVDTVDELRRAREDLARLAVAEERLRFARDLHDLLGHSLSAIALKSELAGRLASVAPARAAEQMREVEQVARSALHDVRQAVAGYRQLALSTELANAQKVLAAADIACVVEADDAPLPAAAAGALAWVVREGVTNVIRHSHAQQCTIRVHRSAMAATVEVCDDGPGDGLDGSSSGGSGLAGLTERVAAAGGTVTAGRVPGGFRLRAIVPLQAGTDGRAVS